MNAACGDSQRGALMRALFETGRATLDEIALMSGIERGELLERVHGEGWVLSDLAARASPGGEAALLRRASARLSADLDAIISGAQEGGSEPGSLAKRLVEISRGIQNLEELADKMDQAANERDRPQGGTADYALAIVEFRERLERQIAALGERDRPHCTT